MKKVVFDRDGYVEFTQREAWGIDFEKEHRRCQEAPKAGMKCLSGSGTSTEMTRAIYPGSTDDQDFLRTTTLASEYQRPFFGIFNRKRQELSFIITLPLKIYSF